MGSGGSSGTAYSEFGSSPGGGSVEDEEEEEADDEEEEEAAEGEASDSPASPGQTPSDEDQADDEEEELPPFSDEEDEAAWSPERASPPEQGQSQEGKQDAAGDRAQQASQQPEAGEETTEPDNANRGSPEQVLTRPEPALLPLTRRTSIEQPGPASGSWKALVKPTPASAPLEAHAPEEQHPAAEESKAKREKTPLQENEQAEAAPPEVAQTGTKRRRRAAGEPEGASPDAAGVPADADAPPPQKKHEPAARDWQAVPFSGKDTSGVDSIQHVLNSVGGGSSSGSSRGVRGVRKRGSRGRKTENAPRLGERGY